MQGDYKVFVEVHSWVTNEGAWRRDQEERHAAGWSRLMRLCESLAKDGVSYSVVLQLDGERPQVRVLAIGQPARKAQTPKAKSKQQAKLALDVCERRHREAVKALNNTERWKRDGHATLEDLEVAIAEAEHWRTMCQLAGKRFDDEQQEVAAA